MLQATSLHSPLNDLAPPSSPGLTASDLRAALDAVVGESLRPVAAGLSLLYAIFAVGHAFILPPPVAAIMIAVASSTAITLSGLSVWLGRRPAPSRWAHPLGAAIAGLVLCNSLLHLYLLSEPQQTTNLVLLVIGVGCFFLSARWLSLILTLTFLGWGGVAWTAVHPPGWWHFGFALLVGTLLSVLIHSLRVRTLRRLQQWRLRDELRQAELERTLAVESETAAELRAILRAFPDLYFRLAADGTILDYHAGRLSDLYVPPAVFLGQRMMDVLPPEVGRLIHGALRRVLETGGLESIEYALPLADGEKFFEARLLPLSPAQVFIMVRDMTERQRTAEALRQAHAELETQVAERTAALVRANASLQEQITERQQEAAERERLLAEVRAAKRIWEQTFDAISDGMIVHDASQRIARCNARVAEMLGLPQPAAAQGLPCVEAFTRLFGQRAATYHLQQRFDTAASFELQAEDGRRYLVSVAPLEGLEPGWGVMTWSDVTELQLMHAHLARARRLATIGQLAAGVAHEINNPLTAVTTCAEAMLRDLRSFTEVTALAESREWPFYLAEIIRQSLRCKAITRGLVDFSSQRRPQREACDLNAVIAECAHLTALRGAAAKVTVAQQLDPRVGEVATDEAMLRQILDHLLSNALEAVGERGMITVSTARDGQCVRLAVADTGRGMTPEVLAHIFEPFFTTKAAGQGAGLGLTICFMLAEALDGDLVAESQPGVGSQFRLSMPPGVSAPRVPQKKEATA